MTDPAGAQLRYQHVLQLVAQKPWAILPETLAVIIDLLSYRSAGFRLSEEEVADRIRAGQERQAQTTRSRPPVRGGVAVLPLYGVIAPRAAQFANVSGPSGTGVDAFTRLFREALAAPDVDSILIDVDSPGGQVGGVPELAREIRAARGRKPISATANLLAASAAYYIASQADEVIAPPSGEVGSIGVYAAHQDVSAALAKEGIKVTLISAGRFKTEGNPFQPLGEEALAAIQADVDAFYGMFLDDVAQGRGVSVDAVRNGFGEGRTVLAGQALEQGMIDRVETFDETLQRLLRGDTATSRRAAAAGITPTAGTDLLPLELAGSVRIPASAFNASGSVTMTVNADGSVTQTSDACVRPEGGTPSQPEHLEDAQRLLRRRAVREHLRT